MLKNNSIVKIISIIAAIVLWAFVIGEVNPTIKKNIADIPVELTNEDLLADKGLALSGNEDYFAEITVKGSRSDVNSLKLEEINATADVYGYKEGENQIEIDVSVPDGISVEEIKTPEITVVLETRESEYLPVAVEFAGETEEHLEAAVISQMPSEIEVSGAASVVNTVKDVAVQLDVSELTEESAVYSVEPEAWSKSGKQVKNISFSVDTVDVEAVLYHVKQVPLELKVTGSPEDKYGEAEISVPKDITVRGTAETLQRITSISAESIDVRDVTENTTIKIKPILPYGVELADSSKNTGIEIEFK